MTFDFDFKTAPSDEIASGESGKLVTITSAEVELGTNRRQKSRASITTCYQAVNNLDSTPVRRLIDQPLGTTIK